MDERWDETWHRLRDWTSGQGPSERLAAQILQSEGYSRIDPSHPLGGKDGKKDAVAYRGNDRWIMAVYFPRGQKSFADTEQKFLSDHKGVSINSACGMAFVTNQQLTLSERQRLADATGSLVDIFHLDRLTHILDRPEMQSVREQFLGAYRSSTQLTPAVVRDIADLDPLEHFVGRREEIDRLQNFLTSGDSRSSVAVISGMAGVGKTALARKVALDLYSRVDIYRTALYVDCNGYALHGETSIKSHAAQAGILQALGHIEIGESPNRVGAQYREALHDLDAKGSAIVLVLDNVSSLEQISSVARPARYHRYLVTTRTGIGNRIPDALSLSVGPLSEAEAVDLIVRQAEVSRPDLRRADSDDVKALADRCGYLPLALHIATAILTAEEDVSVRDLAKELADEAERLATLEFEDLQVRAAFSRSYERLNNTNAECFRLFSLHPGQEPSTESLAAIYDRTGPATRRILRSLRHGYLIDRGSRDGQWKMHDLLRLYSLEQSSILDALAVREEARSRLLKHYENHIDHACEWVNRTPDPSADEENLFPTRTAALQWFDREIENIISCMYDAQENGLHEVAWMLAISAASYPPMTYRHDKSVAVSRTAVSAAEALGDPDKLASALNNLGLALTSARDYDEAIQSFRRALPLYRQLGDYSGEARLLVGLAAAIRDRGDIGASIGPLRRAVRLSTEAKDSYGLGFNLTNLGISLREAGHLEEAARVLEQALFVHRMTGARRAQGSTLCQLGTAIHQVGKHFESMSYLKESIEIAVEVGDTNGQAAATMNLGNAYRSMRQYELALQCYEASAAIFRENDDSTSTALVLVNMSVLRRGQGQQRVADALLAEAAQIDPKWRRARR